jgi:hypothetical protein
MFNLEQPVSHNSLELGISEVKKKKHVLDSLLEIKKLFSNGIFQHNFSDLPVQQISFISGIYVAVVDWRSMAISTTSCPFSILQKTAQT